ncbi:MAG: phosphatidate cytidylyltransferase [Planctomycetota bacterium]|nr:phosphatidate cytidylyltransferase [Planctomycetota bacterium]
MWIRDWIEAPAGWIGLPFGVTAVLLGLFAALVVGSAVRLIHLRGAASDSARSLRLRLRSWWVVLIALTAALLAGTWMVALLFAVVSLLALREYAALVKERERFAGLARWAYGLAPLQYAWAALGWFPLFMAYVPVLLFLLLTLRTVLTRRTEGFIHLVGELQWGMMVLVFLPSHAVFLLSAEAISDAAGAEAGIGLFVYLLVLTEINDIAQALWGRPLGRHKIIPEVSPGKRWEGLIGAAVCTTILAVALAPLLTPFGTLPPLLAEMGAGEGWRWSVPIVAGLMIAIGGFCGDVTMSAVKRDAGVKDSGRLLPGQGGSLDRIDSLTFTAPLLTHGVLLLYSW